MLECHLNMTLCLCSAQVLLEDRRHLGNRRDVSLLNILRRYYIHSCLAITPHNKFTDKMKR